MAEEDMIRQVDYRLPWNRLFCIPVLEQILDRCFLMVDGAVAADTKLNGRQAGEIGSHGTRMAEETLHTGRTMLVMTEFERLSRCRECYGPADENRAHHKHDEKPSQKEQTATASGFSSR